MPGHQSVNKNIHHHVLVVIYNHVGIRGLAFKLQIDSLRIFL